MINETTTYKLSKYAYITNYLLNKDCNQTSLIFINKKKIELKTIKTIFFDSDKPPNLF